MSLPPRQSNAQPELLECLMGQYRRELIAVSYTMQDFVGDFTMEHLKDLAPQERIEGLSTEQLLAALSPEAKEALRRILQGAEPPTSPT